MGTFPDLHSNQQPSASSTHFRKPPKIQTAPLKRRFLISLRIPSKTGIGRCLSQTDIRKASAPPVPRLPRARGGSRTRDQQFRKLLLYPTELPKRFFSLFSFPAKAREAQN